MKSVGFYLGQVPQLLLVPVGLVLLAWPCFSRAWGLHGVKSNKVWQPPHDCLNGRPIDSWDWDWLNKWFGNPEDGVSGQTALIWNGTTLVTYNPDGSRWKAYVWSAWRNSVDALKYKFPQE